MKKSILIFLSIAFVFTACEKDEPVPMPEGTFMATSITENAPIRGFTKEGEIINPTAISKILNDYYNYIQESWDLSFASVDVPDGQIRIQDSFVEYTLMNELLKYDYTRNDEFLFLEMQDSITVDANYLDYFIQLSNSLNVYPLPEFRKYSIPMQTGFDMVIRYKDKRYVEIIDENTLRMHFARYLCAENYAEPENQTFWILPVEFNNYFKETGYPAIREGDTVLVKEFEIEYRKK